MKFKNMIFILLLATLATACASKPAKTEAEKAAAAKAVEGEIVGKPAPGSKFAKLKIGLTLAQVNSLIGPPTKEWTHPTGKMAIPFYFGPDRWVIQYAYKDEGLLTLNYGEEQFLTRIEVNKAEKAD